MARLAFGLMAGGALFIGQAFAEDPDRGMAGCAEIQNSINRLACFDELAKARNVAGPAVETKSKGNWRVSTETSKVDDSVNVYLALDAEAEIDGRFGKSGKPGFYIHCREGSTSLFFEFAGHFMADNGSYGDVTVRIDKQKARTISMSESTDNSVLGLWRGAGVPLLKQLFGRSTLLVRATPFNESAYTAEFSIAGLEEAIKPLRKACSW